MKDFKILGLRLPYYLIALVILFAAVFLGVLPGGMIGAFLLTMLLGGIFDIIGNNTPIVKTYLGGGPIVAIFASAALVYFGVLPEPVIESVETFMKGGGFLDFYIAALITGSILGMNRDLLIKASVRYLPCIIAGVVVSLLFVSIGAPLFGMPWKEAIANIGIPIMGGGMGAGAVPISNVFGEALNVDPATILSKLVPAVALGNAMAIVAAGLLDRLGKKFPNLSGEGQLMRGAAFSAEKEEVETGEEFTFKDFGTGIVLATAFFTFGAILSKVIGMLGINLHTYAYMIISVALVKSFKLLPARYEQVCARWYKFIADNFTSALLVGIGIAYTDLGDIIAAITPSYLVLVALVVLGAILGSALLGQLIGFYPIEAAITAGLCMANMGGTGDVAVLTAAHRMELMPFAQISSRIGGALIILLATVMVPILF